MLKRRMMMQDSLPDTSPLIRYYNKSYGSRTTLTDSETGCVTELYPIEGQDYTQTICYSGMQSNLVVWNGVKNWSDYWASSEHGGTDARNVIATKVRWISFTVKMANLDACYAYLLETGEILFAGRQSIYYGHLNLDEVDYFKPSLFWGSGSTCWNGEEGFQYYEFAVPNGTYRVSTDAVVDSSGYAGVFAANSLVAPTTSSHGVTKSSFRTVTVSAGSIFLYVRTVSPGGYTTFDETSFAQYKTRILAV